MAEAGGKYQGLRLGAITRNSTARQEGNYSELAQDVEFRDYLVREGAQVVPFDEKAISGRDLSQREQASLLLELIRSKDLDGIAGYSVDRLTRDETMLDAGTIIRACQQARAIIVTYERDYRVWLTQDLKDFKSECAASGDHMMRSRDAFYRGLFPKAEREPFFMGQPPYGYTTYVDEVWTAGRHARKKLVRRPIKDEKLAPVMEKLAEAFDECLTLGEVCRRLNRLGLFPVATYGDLKGKPVKWQPIRLEYILRNSIYHGIWEYGWHSKRQSSIWDAPSGEGRRRDQRYQLDVPELLWWARDRHEAWGRKLLRTRQGPSLRTREYPRPLRGILACNGCGRLMVAAGATGYLCPVHGAYRQSGACPAPQALSQKGALACLRRELPKAVQARRDWREGLRVEMLASPELTDLRAKVRTIEAQLDEAAERYYGPAALGKVPEAVDRMLVAKQATLDELRAKLARLELAMDVGGREERISAELLAGRLGDFDKWPLERQAVVYRRTFADFRVKATGWGGSRQYQVVGYTNRLLGTELAPGEARTALDYLSTLVPE
jgi:hypothetical protein